jgi:hypothetical protein
MLAVDEISLDDLELKIRYIYNHKSWYKALIRDLNYLLRLKAIKARPGPGGEGFVLWVNLEWPTEITDTEFFQKTRDMPKAKVHGFLSA